MLKIVSEYARTKQDFLSLFSVLLKINCESLDTQCYLHYMTGLGFRIILNARLCLSLSDLGLLCEFSSVTQEVPI